MNEIRMNTHEREAFVVLYAVSIALERLERHMKPVVQRATNGWRDYRLAKSKLDSLSKAIIQTIPQNQIRAIQNHMMVSEFKLVPKSVTKMEDHGFWVISKDDLTELVKAACETTCALCDGKQKCELRRILDEVPVLIERDYMMPCRSGRI